MDELSLEYATCKKCGTIWFVGINGKDLRKAPKSSGEAFGTPYVALDNPTIEHAPKSPEHITCPDCNIECIVESSSGSSGDLGGRSE